MQIQKSDNIKLIDNLDEEIENSIILLRKKVDDKEVLQEESNTSDSDFTGYVKKIGIRLSQSCITMIKNDIPTTCPSYELLQQLDSSIIDVSGKFGFKDGFFQRLKPSIDNSWRWYDFDNHLRIFVDPPAGMESRIKMIEITPNLNTYLIKNNQYQPQKYEYTDIEIINPLSKKTETITIKVETQKQGRILFHDRFIDNYCDVSKITSDNWEKLLLDTINHMRLNCIEGSTSFDNMEFIPAKITEFDMTTSPSWQALQWFESAKKECKELC